MCSSTQVYPNHKAMLRQSHLGGPEATRSAEVKTDARSWVKAQDRISFGAYELKYVITYLFLLVFTYY